MRVFVTGASGFIGSAVVPELIGAGHQVLGLARSDAAAAAIAAAGAAVQRGDLDDLDSLRAGAAACDGVIHLAFKHDFLNFASGAQADLRAITAIGSVLEGSSRPFVIASGLIGLAQGRVATERDLPAFAANQGAGAGALATGLATRAAGVHAALSLTPSGVRTSIVRLAPSVHDQSKAGFATRLAQIAREKGVSGYVGDGASRWPALHVLDAASLFRLGLEKAPAGAILHGAGEEGVPLRAIAEVIGRRLGVPVHSIPSEQAGEHFGWMAGFIGMDSPASSALTQELLGWQPTHPGLLEDLEHARFFDEAAA